ncbi:MAG: transcription termination/antitermination factor NusG [Clostridia bacterium]|nr:transcription termination/antitermination factor NusG [Clostridia bacterium]
MEEVVDRSSLASWYVIHTYSTYEVAVRDNILKMVENIGLQDYIFDVVVVFEEEITESKGKRKVVLKKKYPTYAFIKMIYTDHVYYNVTRIRGVTGFVGAGGRPEALTPEEVRRIGLEKVKAEDLGIQIGDQVRIINGAFESYYGEVQEINAEAGTLKVVLSMFGKPTPIELEFNQVEKA